MEEGDKLSESGSGSAMLSASMRGEGERNRFKLLAQCSW